jgi:hypothetical protein
MRDSFKRGKSRDLRHRQYGIDGDRAIKMLQKYSLPSK